MSQVLEEKIVSAIRFNLDLAEKNWAEKGHFLLESAETMRAGTASFDSMPSNIPNHPRVPAGRVVEDKFIALVADMRDSSKHMLNAISEKKTKRRIPGVERIYYETSALLPSLDETIAYHGGRVTEYLGDGVLALFHYEDKETIYSARHAAEDIIGCMRNYINEEIKIRYGFPEIHLGVGLAISNCFVTLVGSHGNLQPKVFGHSVYRASKLSKGWDKTCVDDYLYRIWPKSKDGVLRFNLMKGNDFKGYVINKK